MEKVKVRLVLKDGTEVPSYATEGSVGFDLKAKSLAAYYQGDKEWPLQVINQKVKDSGKIIVKAHDRVLIGTGIHAEIPEGYEIQIRPKSGISTKKGLIVILGTIDHDYTGEIKVTVVNTTAFPATIMIDNFIAQGVLSEKPRAEFEVVGTISDTAPQSEVEKYLKTTERSDGGFGHTGEK